MDDDDDDDDDDDIYLENIHKLVQKVISINYGSEFF